MRKRGSYRAIDIDREYRTKKKYENNQIKRQKCKMKDCERCRYEKVCNENKSLEELEEQI